MVEINTNVLDFTNRNNFGIIICTSGTRPTAVDGKAIYETDTDKLLIYDGASWEEMGGDELVIEKDCLSWNPIVGALIGTYGITTYRAFTTAGNDDQVNILFYLPDDWGTDQIGFELFWFMPGGATTGVVRWIIYLNARADGEAWPAAGVDEGMVNDASVPGVAQEVQKTTFSTANSYDSGDIISIALQRQDSHANDTAVGSAGGMILVITKY